MKQKLQELKVLPFFPAPRNEALAYMLAQTVLHCPVIDDHAFPSGEKFPAAAAEKDDGAGA